MIFLALVFHSLSSSCSHKVNLAFCFNGGIPDNSGITGGLIITFKLLKLVLEIGRIGKDTEMEQELDFPLVEYGQGPQIKTAVFCIIDISGLLETLFPGHIAQLITLLDTDQLSRRRPNQNM